MTFLDKTTDFGADWTQDLSDLSVLGTSERARRSLAELVRKVRAHPDGPRQLEAAAEGRFKAHRWGEAAVGYLVLAEIDPDRKDIVRKGGDCLLRANRYDVALAPLRRIAGDPEFARRSQFPALNLGRCLVGLGRWQEALESLEQARKLKSDFPATHAALARAHLGAGNMAAFETHLAKLVELEPGQPDTVFLEAMDAARRGALAQALGRLRLPQPPQALRLRLLETLLQAVGDGGATHETVQQATSEHAALLGELLRLFSAFGAEVLIPLLPWLHAIGDPETLDAWIARIEAEGEDLLTPEACRCIAQARVAAGRFEEASLWLQRAETQAEAAAPSVAETPGPQARASSSAAGFVDETDIAHAPSLLLARAPRRGEDWSGWIGQPLNAFLEHLLLSEEFRADVLPQLAATPGMPATPGTAPDGVSDWAARRLPLLRETAAAVQRTPDPLVRLKLILGDPEMAHRLAPVSSVEALRRGQAMDVATASGTHLPEADDAADWDTLLTLPPLVEAAAGSRRREHFQSALGASKPSPGNLEDLLALLRLYRKEFGADDAYVKLLAECLVHLKMFDRLLVLCTRALDRGLDASGAYWYKAMAEDGLGLLEEAVTSGLMSLAALPEPSPNRTLEIGRLAFRSSHGSLGKYPARPAHAFLARDLVLQARHFGRADGVPEYELARMALWRGVRDEAIANARAAVAIKPDSKNVRLLAHCYLFFGEYAQAADLVAGHDFRDDPFLFIKRLIARFGTPGTEAGGADAFRDPSGAALDPTRLPVNPGSLSHVGEIRLVSEAAPDFPIRFRNLALWSPGFDTARRSGAGLVTLTCRTAHGTGSVEIALDRAHQADEVLLASKAGKAKFGGAEHFLYQAAEEYRARGLAPAFLGLGDLPDDPGDEDGLPCIWAAHNVEAIRAGIVARAPKIVHSVTGLGLEVAEALKGSSIYHVHGVHFWRDLKFSRAQPENSWFQDVEALPIREEFNAVLTGHGTVYANSEYTRDLVRADFGVTLPVVPSLAPEAAAPHEADGSEADGAEAAGRDAVLLVNSRRDKGGYFVLDIAERLPETRFVLIRSQDQSERMALEVRRRGLGNVELLDRVDDMEALYRRTRVALVPSFDFVESFSRVPVEAHRHGIPVIGADVGNVARLLETPGISLPREPGAWAAEISALFSDPDYYATRREAALESSRRWSYEAFREGIDRLARAQKAPILVAVGTGLGNMLHTTPAIEWLSRYFDAPVDIVMSGDWDEADRLFAGSPFVNMIFPLDNRILTKPYTSVFVLHSFGDGRYDFTAEAVHYSREWRRFDPSGPLHERDFNIAFAAAALGVDSSASRGGYFLGDRSYTRPKTCRRIGLHAGSKANHWAIKRWPYFAELAAELTRRGYEVVSFGGPAEGVEFSQQLTGLPLERSIDEIMRCDYFISNDSGVMNIANALGVPQAALFAPTNPATRGPVNTDSLIIQVDKDCSPCETKRELYGDMISKGGCACMRELSLDLVLGKVLDHIDSVYG